MSRLSTAYHEAGHCVAAELLGIGVVSVSIIPEPSASGHTVYTAKRHDALNRMITAYSGPIAERYIDPGADTRAWAADLGHAADALMELHRETREPVSRIAQRAVTSARGLVAKHRTAIQDVARLLMERRMITGQHVTAAVRKYAVRAA